MSGWAKKRFWKEVSVVAEGDGWSVRLDGRAVKTPAKAPLSVPTETMAQAIAAEWAAQEGEIDPNAMPVTRAANSAIDKVAPQFEDVADMLAEYGGSDLLCYRATSPDELIARQAEAWDPLLDWVADTLDARLEPVAGVMHVAQDSAALERLGTEVRGFNNFELAAFHDLVSLSGSLVLGLAAVHEIRPLEEIWQVSRIDETWQEELWGVDEEARETAEGKFRAFLQAGRFFRMSRK